MPAPSPPLGAADFDAIEAAVMETARGRWFLQEYSRRNRQADTEMLLTAIERLERATRADTAASFERVRMGLMDMADAITKAKTEIAALRLQDAPGGIDEAREELYSVVNATEAATSDILAAAERIQETAWRMREQGIDARLCDALDARTTDIYTACSFQDLTGQRTRKVIQVLRYLESRIQAMVDLWGAGAPQHGHGLSESGERALLSGPARPGEGLAQVDVDRLMRGVRERANNDQPEPVASVCPPNAEAPMPFKHDPLAPLLAMSYEQKIALFT